MAATVFERMNLTEGGIVWSIKFHPHDPSIMFLGTEGAEVFKSTDGGENWEYLATVSNPDAVQMAFATRILGIGIEAADTNQMLRGPGSRRCGPQLRRRQDLDHRQQRV